VTAFLALSVAAALLGFASRRTQAARLSLLLVPVVLVVALLVTALLKHQADTLGGATSSKHLRRLQAVPQRGWFVHRTFSYKSRLQAPFLSQVSRPTSV
jgi:hypothetical protein